MAPSNWRKAIGAVKDQTTISLAKVGTSPSLSDLDVAIVKATRHEEYPPDERYIREIINLTCYSRAHVAACVSSISRRLNKTKNWVVAIKTLMLIHKLLWDGDKVYEQEFFFATRRGTRLLNMSDFCDKSRSNSWDYSAFVRTYGLYLDEQLEYKMQGKRGKGGYTCDEEIEEETNSKAMVVKENSANEMTSESLFSRIHHLMQLLDRFLACRPTGVAKHNRIVTVALYPIVKESFLLYEDLTETMGILIDRFLDLDIQESVQVYEIMCRLSKQYDELDESYTWCKADGIARSSEYPAVEKITQKKLAIMEKLISEKSGKRKIVEATSTEPEPAALEAIKGAEPEKDMNATKALPPPEGFLEKTDKEEKNDEEEKPKELIKKPQEGDLLNLGADAPSTEEQGDKMALVLFDGGPTGGTSTASPWEAFKDSSGDWETALVQHTTHLPNQKANLPRGFDTLILDGMYQQGAMVQAAASSGLVATGSASSVALGSAGRAAVLALPAPPSADGSASNAQTNTDPFAASLSIAPPSYVEMSEMERKQRLLVEEQLMWQQYARDGMQGQVGLANVQQTTPYPYTIGGYATTY